MAYISVTRLSGQLTRVNSRQIETMEAEPDTRLHLLTGEPVVVRETAEEVVNAIATSRRRRVYGLPIDKGRTGLA